MLPGRAPSWRGPVRSSRVWQELKMLEQLASLPGATSVLLAHCQAAPSLAPCSRARRESQWSRINTADLRRIAITNNILDIPVSRAQNNTLSLWVLREVFSARLD